MAVVLGCKNCAVKWSLCCIFKKEKLDSQIEMTLLVVYRRAKLSRLADVVDVVQYLNECTSDLDGRSQ